VVDVTPAAFKATLSADAPPAGLSPALETLWWAGKGDWDRAHNLATDHLDDDDCAWVHAHLHRIEGDLPNARWWYNRARRPAQDGPLDAEWDAIAGALLEG